MAGASFKIDFDDNAQIRDLFADLRQVLSGEMKPLFTEIGADLEQSTRERIETTKTGPDGTPWPDISEAWRDDKRERGLAEGILTMRGDLLNSIRFEASDNSLQMIAGPTEYAAIHQFGGETGRRGGRFTMLARPFLGLSRDDQANIIDAVRDMLERHASRG